jgi:hypothetical protein
MLSAIQERSEFCLKLPVRRVGSNAAFRRDKEYHRRHPAMKKASETPETFRHIFKRGVSVVAAAARTTGAAGAAGAAGTAATTATTTATAGRIICNHGSLDAAGPGACSSARRRR